MTKNEKRELERILDHHIIYSKKTHEYTLLKPRQDLSKALTKFINRVQLRVQRWPRTEGDDLPLSDYLDGKTR